MSMEGLNAPLAPHDDLGARLGGDYKRYRSDDIW